MTWYSSKKRRDSDRRQAAIDADIERAKRELAEAEEEVCYVVAEHTRVVCTRSKPPAPVSGTTLLEELI